MPNFNLRPSNRAFRAENRVQTGTQLAVGGTQLWAGYSTIPAAHGSTPVPLTPASISYSLVPSAANLFFTFSQTLVALVSLITHARSPDVLFWEQVARFGTLILCLAEMSFLLYFLATHTDCSISNDGMCTAGFVVFTFKLAWILTVFGGGEWTNSSSNSPAAAPALSPSIMQRVRGFSPTEIPIVVQPPLGGEPGDFEIPMVP